VALLSGEVRAERRAERLGEKDRDCEGDREARVRAARLHVVDVRRIAGAREVGRLAAALRLVQLLGGLGPRRRMRDAHRRQALLGKPLDDEVRPAPPRDRPSALAALRVPVLTLGILTHAVRERLFWSAATREMRSREAQARVAIRCQAAVRHRAYKACVDRQGRDAVVGEEVAQHDGKLGVDEAPMRHRPRALVGTHQPARAARRLERVPDRERHLQGRVTKSALAHAVGMCHAISRTHQSIAALRPREAVAAARALAVLGVVRPAEHLITKGGVKRRGG